jgi:hypothetical protein
MQSEFINIDARRKVNLNQTIAVFLTTDPVEITKAWRFKDRSSVLPKVLLIILTNKRTFYLERDEILTFLEENHRFSDLKSEYENIIKTQSLTTLS